MKCIGEKCPKYRYKYGFYHCNFDPSCSHYELTYCKVEEYFLEIEKDFVQLKCLYDLISKHQI